MISEKWEQVKELFETAIEQDLGTRKVFLSNLSHEDPLIAEQVAALIVSYERARDFLNQPCALDLNFFEDFEIDKSRFSVGEILCNRFKIISLVGKGGMGEVYDAWDEELDDHVALKVLRLEISSHEIFTSRFRRELQLARRVTHPNVCRISDSFKHAVGGGTYITVLSMELLEGPTLAEYLSEKGGLDLEEAMPLAIQLIMGLHAIHAAGIIHRDLKPSNLILIPVDAFSSTNAQTALTSHLAIKNQDSSAEKIAGSKAGAAKHVGSAGNYQLKITDFGIAGRLPDGLSPQAQTQASKLMGTPDYMTPEQLEQGHTSIQSDIYSLGLVLYEMVTGAKPFSGVSAWTRITTDPPPPNKLANNLSENWNRTIRCCLERNPRYRFQNAQAVMQSLALAAEIPRKPFLVHLNHAARTRAGRTTFFFYSPCPFLPALFAISIRGRTSQMEQRFWSLRSPLQMPA